MKEASQYFGKSTPQYLCQYDAMIYEYCKLCFTYFVSPQRFCQISHFSADHSVWQLSCEMKEDGLFIYILFIEPPNYFR